MEREEHNVVTNESAAAVAPEGDLPPVTAVGSSIALEVVDEAELVFSIAAARSARRLLAERLELDGADRADLVEIESSHGTRLHAMRARPGRISVSYSAEFAGDDSTAGEQPDRVDAPPFEVERLVYVRPSRYCPSDRLEGFARSEFGSGARPEAIASWIHGRIEYLSGSSDGLDGADHTLLSGRGVCRDFAHLGITLCRALGIPARYASVYAPGLDPMDYHAVFETWSEGRWWVHDATELVSRDALVRIATGRDAADAAFLSVNTGRVNLGVISVGAARAAIPSDDHERPVQLA